MSGLRNVGRRLRGRSMNRLLLDVGFLQLFGVMLRLRVRHSVLRVLANFGLWRMGRLFFELFLLAFRRFFARGLLFRWVRVFRLASPDLSLLLLRLLCLQLLLFRSGIISGLFNERLQFAVGTLLTFCRSAWSLWFSLCDRLDLGFGR